MYWITFVLRENNSILADLKVISLIILMFQVNPKPISCPGDTQLQTEHAIV